MSDKREIKFLKPIEEIKKINFNSKKTKDSFNQIEKENKQLLKGQVRISGIINPLTF